MELLFNLKKEGNSAIGYNTDEPWGQYAKWKKPVTKSQRPYDNTSVKYLEYHIHKVGRQTAGTGGKGKQGTV